MVVHQAIADSQAKLNLMRKKHTALMEKYTDLEMEYDSVKAQLDAMQAIRGHNGHHGHVSDLDGEGYSISSHDHSMTGAVSSRDGAYDTALKDLTAFSEAAYIASASDPSGRHYVSKIGGGLPVSPPASEATLHSTAGLTWKPPVSRQDSIASRGSSVPATVYNQTAPLQPGESNSSAGKSALSDHGNEVGKKKEKITPDSQMRVYGRGGAQNMKMKSKDKDGADKPEKEKKGGFKSLKNLV
ncbi:hypothetical protein B0A54_17207 [Friedmanniomyces endolithicus]|nr:hypothetical protein B0A54_17207 [Friedmanniomyces endolithicus]